MVMDRETLRELRWSTGPVLIALNVAGIVDVSLSQLALFGLGLILIELLESAIARVRTRLRILGEGVRLWWFAVTCAGYWRLPSAAAITLWHTIAEPFRRHT